MQILYCGCHRSTTKHTQHLAFISCITNHTLQNLALISCITNNTLQNLAPISRITNHTLQNLPQILYITRKKVISFLLSLQAFLCVSRQSRSQCLWFCDTYLWCLRTPSQNRWLHHTSELQISKKSIQRRHKWSTLTDSITLQNI